MRDPAHPDLDDVDITHVLHALSDPMRLAVVRTLSRGGEMHCAQINEILGQETGRDLGKSTMSHHYAALRESGIVRARIEGQRKYLRLRSDELADRFPGLLDSVIGTTAAAGHRES